MSDELIPLAKAQNLLGQDDDPNGGLTPYDEDVAWLRLRSERYGVAFTVRYRTGCSEKEAQDMIECIEDVMCDGMIRSIAGAVAELGTPGAGHVTRQTELAEAVIMADPRYRMEGGTAFQMGLRVDGRWKHPHL